VISVACRPDLEDPRMPLASDPSTDPSVGQLTQLMTLDELTRRVGMSVRNVRFYTTKGLVPPPIRRGRSGYYSSDHLARLELVRELQAHGFTLSAIEKYVARIPADASPETIALHRTLLAPWMAELPETITRKELSRRAGRTLSDDDLDTLNALGIVFPTKQGKLQVAIAHLSVGIALLDLGMPLDAALAAQDIFTEHGRKVAEELTELFRTKVWPAYKEGDSSPDQLRVVVERFKPVTVQALVTAYESAILDTTFVMVSRPSASASGTSTSVGPRWLRYERREPRHQRAVRTGRRRRSR
jgi:DNA-binding transcriptional MerR regulator